MRIQAFVPILVVAAVLGLGRVHAQCPTSVVASFPWVENFDGFGAVQGSTVPPADWNNVVGENGGGADADWYFYNQATPTGNTGPTADHTTGLAEMGFFAYVEDSGGHHAAVQLETPCLDLSGLSLPVLSFWLHSNNSQGPGGANENFLSVDVIEYPAMGGPISSSHRGSGFAVSGRC